MAKKDFPEWYEFTKKRFKKVITTLEKLGETTRKEGPWMKDVAFGPVGRCSRDPIEGSVHSHARRPLRPGLSPTRSITPSSCSRAP